MNSANTEKALCANIGKNSHSCICPYSRNRNSVNKNYNFAHIEHMNKIHLHTMSFANKDPNSQPEHRNSAVVHVILIGTPTMTGSQTSITPDLKKSPHNKKKKYKARTNAETML